MSKKGSGLELAQVFSITFEMGFMIALPLVIFGLLGKFLDNKYHTGYYVYLGIALAITLTSILLYRRFARILEKLKEEIKIKQAENNQKKDQTENPRENK